MNRELKRNSPRAGTTAGPFSITSGSGPLFQRVKLEVVKMLSHEAYAAGQPIPTERELRDMFQVSVGTVRRAIDELVAERILVRHQGRGTFLAQHGDSRMTSVFWRLVDRDGGQYVPLVQTLHFGPAVASADCASALRLGSKDAVWQFRLLIVLDGKPVSVEHVTVPQQLFPHLDRDMISSRDRVNYALYQEEFGVIVTRVEDMIGAVPAGADHGRLLNIAPATPILEVVRTAFSIDERPVELRRSVILTTDYRYKSCLPG